MDPLRLPPEFLIRIETVEQPVILLEGTRSISPAEVPRLSAFAQRLALQIPRAVFRSGNAPGSDDAFCRGIESVDPARLEQCTPSARHRKATLHAKAKVVSFDALPPHVADSLVEKTVEASPRYEPLLKNRAVPSLKIKADYLLRDTLKVHGDGVHFPPADIGIFYVNPADHEGGGTGHTMGVCRKMGTTLVYTQYQWMDWGTF